MRLRRRGFTLIELLTVIAIISILAGLVAYGVPQALNKAKQTSVLATMRDISTSLAAYYGDHGSYPPGYGYQRFNAQAPLGPEDYWLQPWHAIAGIYDSNAYNDKYSESVDMNRDGRIQLLEYAPLGTKGSGSTVYPSGLFSGEPASGDVAADLARAQLEPRSLLYVPVNKEDFRKVALYLNDQSAGDYIQRQMARSWNVSDARIAAVVNRPNLAPPRYDAFVLISVGPNGSSAGIVADPPAGSNINPYYHAGLLTYFLATRDQNGNNEADYDYRSRTGGGSDSGPEAYSDPALVSFPDGTNLPGPLIFQSN